MHVFESLASQAAARSERDGLILGIVILIAIAVVIHFAVIRRFK